MDNSGHPVIGPTQFSGWCFPQEIYDKNMEPKGADIICKLFDEMGLIWDIWSHISWDIHSGHLGYCMRYFNQLDMIRSSDNGGNEPSISFDSTGSYN